jgi:hypothetical protein
MAARGSVNNSSYSFSPSSDAGKLNLDLVVRHLAGHADHILGQIDDVYLSNLLHHIVHGPGQLVPIAQRQEETRQTQEDQASEPA